MERRTPQQTRGRETRARILGAAHRIVSDDGVEALNPTRVANETGSAVGTVYSYFDGSAGLIDALVDDHLERLVDIVRQTVDPRSLHNVDAVTDELIDAFVDYYRNAESFAEVWYGTSFTHRHRSANSAANDVMVDLCADLLLEAGIIDSIDDHAHHELAVAWCIGEALLDRAVTAQPFETRYVQAAKETLRLWHQRPDGIGAPRQ